MRRLDYTFHYTEIILVLIKLMGAEMLQTDIRDKSNIHKGQPGVFHHFALTTNLSPDDADSLQGSDDF